VSLGTARGLLVLFRLLFHGNLFLAGIGTFLLLPVIWFSSSWQISIDARTLGWIVLSALLFIALGETLYVFGVQAAERAGDIRLFALTALFFPVILAVLEIQTNPLDPRFLVGFLVMAIGFSIIITR
jgi:hypothetical protein